MKKFNQVITVEVSVDSVAQHLLSTISDSFPHGEQVVETIIGAMLNDNKLGFLYNSLNGYSNDINFVVGQSFYCSTKKYMYKSEESREKNDTQMSEIGQVLIKDINIYDKDKVLVSYDFYNKDGSISTKEDWVNHLTLSVIAV
jgi:hypothetical protein